jgi:HPt (histidine-containing phosphotransfer) domain-containing protein
MEPLLDLDFLIHLSGNDKTYISQVIQIFLENIPDGVKKLEHLVLETDDYYQIERQAHLLKSSAGIVKVRGMFDNLAKMEQLAKGKTGKEEIITRLHEVLENFKLALPLLQAEYQAAL